MVVIYLHSTFRPSETPNTTREPEDAYETRMKRARLGSHQVIAGASFNQVFE